MPIQFSCSCGKRLQMKEEWAGKAVRCPGCSSVVTVPAASPSPPSIAPPMAVPVPAPVAVSVPAPVPAPLAAPLPPIVPVAPAPAAAAPTEQIAWLFPPKTENFLLAVTDQDLWAYSKIFSTVRPEQEKLQARGDPGEVLGKDARRIPLTNVQKVALDKKRANLLIHYKERNKQDRWVEKTREYFIDDVATRDQLFAALRQRLGPGWQIREEQVSPVWGIVGHVILLLLTVGAVPLLLWVIHWLQGPDLLSWMVGGSGRVRLVQWTIHGFQALLRWLGFILDGLVVLVAAIAFVFWTVLGVSHVRMPPLMWYLERPGGDRDSPSTSPASLKTDTAS